MKTIELTPFTGYPHLLIVARDRIEFIHTGEVNVGDKLLVYDRSYTVAGINETREQKGSGHSDQAVWFNVAV